MITFNVFLKGNIFLFNLSVMKPHYCYLVHSEKKDNRPTSTELWKEFKSATTSHGIPHVNKARGKVLYLAYNKHYKLTNTEYKVSSRWLYT